ADINPSALVEPRSATVKALVTQNAQHPAQLLGSEFPWQDMGDNTGDSWHGRLSRQPRWRSACPRTNGVSILEAEQAMALEAALRIPDEVPASLQVPLST